MDTNYILYEKLELLVSLEVFLAYCLDSLFGCGVVIPFEIYNCSLSDYFTLSVRQCNS